MTRDEDFDIASLANYLHLTPQQVERLASRDQIPCRRVGGEIRFSPAEIHHWMEERMGVLDDAELAQVEDQLQPAHEDLPLTVAQHLSLDTIALPLVARTRNSVINAMTQLAANTGLLWDPEKMAEAVRSREDLQSTAMDSGVALLHPRRPLPNILGDTIIALGMTGQGIPFGGSHVLTDVFWLVCSVDDRSHLRALARISRLLAADAFLEHLRSCHDAVAVLQLIQDTERVIDG